MAIVIRQTTAPITGISIHFKSGVDSFSWVSTTGSVGSAKHG